MLTSCIVAPLKSRSIINVMASMHGIQGTRTKALQPRLQAPEEFALSGGWHAGTHLEQPLLPQVNAFHQHGACLLQLFSHGGLLLRHRHTIGRAPESTAKILLITATVIRYGTMPYYDVIWRGYCQNPMLPPKLQGVVPGLVQ